MLYSDIICNCNNIDDIINCCHEALPSQYKAKPWTHPELNHGVDLLASEDALNCYMSAYGDMHVTKCRAAMMNFPFEELQGSIEIVDWGCGQGVGSATIVEILKQHNLYEWIRRITLIEPAENAINRAFQNINKLTHETIDIDIKNNFLPQIGVPTDECTLTAIGYRATNIIHIFSNILDVKSLDLGAIARMVASSHGKHFILCIGPKNSASYRIDKFCSVFGVQKYFSNIDSTRFAHTRRTAHYFTCMTRCFMYNGASIDLSRLSLYNENEEEVFNDYNYQLQIQNKVMSLEKARVAWRLESILSVDDIMYIDAVINEISVDFVIVRPNKGLIIINLVDEELTGATTNNTQNEFSAIEKIKSAINLIQICQTSIKDGIEELLMSTIESSRNFGLIKKVLIFTKNSSTDIEQLVSKSEFDKNYTSAFCKEFISDRNISLNMYNSIGLLYNNSCFDDAIRRKLAKIISPSWHSYQEGHIDMQPIGAQQKLSESRLTQQKISGVAGSGKTQVLVFRAINAMKRTGGNVLILTYNITLANYLKLRLSEIREDFSWEKVDIYPYHQFFRIRAAECKLHVSLHSYEDENFFDNSSNHKKYDAIFVDEVQDYTTEWLHILMKHFLVNSNCEFVVFGDPKQNIYKRPIDKNGDIRIGVISGEWNRQLKNGRRFINPHIAALATKFQSTFMTNMPIDDIETPEQSALNFRNITYIDMRTAFTIDSLINNIIDIINNDNNSEQDFVILSSSTNVLRNIDLNYRRVTNKKTEITFISAENKDRLSKIHNVTDNQMANWKYKNDHDSLERTRKQLFTTDKRCLKLSTIQSFKGWESPSVIVILESDASYNQNLITHETIYTAITRARENLHIINIGNNIYHNFFNNQII